MANKSGDGYLLSEVPDRSLVYDPCDEGGTRRHSDGGGLMSTGEDGDRFKGVRKEQ